MRSVRHLHLEGHLVATADVADTYQHDGDQWSSLFVFRTDDGFTLVTLGRSETYGVSGAVERGIADITVDYPADVRQLEEVVSERFRVGSDAWWQMRAAATTMSSTPPGFRSGCVTTYTKPVSATGTSR